ncbi:unnamed protein product [Linum trigynum]|uniref:Uncharacterized protein n=1 Tax=Linum trigynum TaxID=586398 RepID=A0AAV2EWA6_9ROSI
MSSKHYLILPRTPATTLQLIVGVLPTRLQQTPDGKLTDHRHEVVGFQLPVNPVHDNVATIVVQIPIHDLRVQVPLLGRRQFRDAF